MSELLGKVQMGDPIATHKSGTEEAE